MTDRRARSQLECAVPSCHNRVTTDAPICTPCWNGLERDLAQLPALIADLDVTITRQARTTTRNGSRGSDKPLPYNPAASRVLDDVDRSLNRWLSWCADRSPTFARRWERGWTTTTGKAIALLSQYQLIRAQGIAIDLIVDIDRITRAAMHAIDRAPDRWYAGACGYVDDNGVECPEHLYAIAGQPTIVCRTCGSEWDVTARRHFLLEVARDQLVTTAEACAAVKTYAGGHLTSSTVRSWKNRGRLTTRGQTPNGHDLYRLGDITDLATGRDTKEHTHR